MAPIVYKISINLRDRGDRVLTFAARSESGKILRTGGLVNDKESLSRVVVQALETVQEYDYTLHELAHELAVKAAKAQVGEQAGKGA